MNTSKTEQRMEKLRKSRSLNDVISVVGDVSKDVRSHKTVVKRMVAKAASKEPKSIVIDNTGLGVMPKMPMPTKPQADSTKKKRGSGGGKITLPRKQLSSGIKVTKYIAPSVENAEKMQNSVDVIHDLHENLHELEAAKAKIKQQFFGAKNLAKVINGIDALHAEVNDTLMDAYDLLDAIAKKHVPAELTEMKNVLTAFIQNTVPEGKYKSMHAEIYVTMKAVDNMTDGEVKKKKAPKKIQVDTASIADFAFHYYILFDSLKNEKGYEFPQYCIVLTGLVSRNGVMNFFLNAMPDFKPPGKFNIGQEVEDENALGARLQMLLAHNDVVTEFERKPMPLTTKTAKEKGFHSIPDVTSVTVDDDLLKVRVKSGLSHDEIENIKTEVRSLLAALVGPRSKSKVLPRKVIGAKGETILYFSLIPDIPDTAERRDVSINIGKLHDLKKALGLPDEIVEAVKHAMLQHS